MAFTFGFYNSMRGDRKYNADQVGALFDGLLNDGVYASIGEIFATVPGEGMSVVVKTGRAWFNRTWNENNSHMILTLSESNVLLPRFDAVVLEVDKRDTVRQNRIIIVEGTPSANPVHPNLINNAEVGFFQHPLAYVKVDPNVIAIAPDKIQIMVGTAQCPFVTGILRLSSIDDLYQGWEYQFQEWWKGIKALLNENTVGRLQTQIDERVKYTDKVDVNNLNQILSDDNAHWMTPASTKKAIANQANPLGTSVLPGQQPSGVGSWAQSNGMYIQNMPDGPVKQLYKKRFGYWSNFYYYPNFRVASKACDSRTKNQAFLLKASDDSSAKCIIGNPNSGSVSEVACDVGTTGIGYLGGVLGFFNRNGHFYWNGQDLTLDVPYRPHVYAASGIFYQITPDRLLALTSAYVGSSEAFQGGIRIINSAGAVERYIASSMESPRAFIKLEDGVPYAITPNYRYNLNTLSKEAVSKDTATGIIKLVLDKFKSISDGNVVCWSSDFDYIYLNDYIIRIANGGQIIPAGKFMCDMGEHVRAIRLDPYASRRSLGWASFVSMGIPGELAPRIAIETCPLNYSYYGPPMIYASSVYASDFVDASFSSIDQDVFGSTNSTSTNRTNDWEGASFPTMMGWSSYNSPSNNIATIMIDDPTKVRVPYDQSMNLIRYA